MNLVIEIKHLEQLLCYLDAEQFGRALNRDIEMQKIVLLFCQVTLCINQETEIKHLEQILCYLDAEQFGLILSTAP
jgi:hypothetical protein